MIIITREDGKGLTRQTWDFTPIDYHGKFLLILTRYAQQERPTKRHGWRNIKELNYDRYERTRSSYQGIREPADVPLPPDVEQEAISAAPVKVVREL